MNNETDKIETVAKHTDINNMFSQFVDKVKQLNLVLPGSNIYVDGQRATLKNYPAIRNEYINYLPENVTMDIQPLTLADAEDVYDKLVDAAVKFNQIRNVSVEVYHAISTSEKSYSEVEYKNGCSAYVSMLSQDIPAVDTPNISDMTYDFDMFSNNLSSEFRDMISSIQQSELLSAGNLMSYENTTNFINYLYDNWKTGVDNNTMIFKVYSCHTNCHSNCHSNGRSRR